ncbi:MAG: type II secretion system protein [Clostridia bacterium]|nr:type II secretion system protein [Clostridia bacterium]NCC44925.1 type II secretion system protein [Clostridia bacterium]
MNVFKKNHIIKKINRCRRKGYTLVELIVVFALIGIFMSAGAAVVGAYYKVATRISDISHAQVVADTLLNDISSQIVSLRYDPSKDWNDQIWINADSMTFENHLGQRVTIETDESKLLSYVYIGETENSRVTPYGAETYMDNTVSELSFEPVGDDFASTGLIRVTLTLERDRNVPVTYTDSRIISCYNVESTGE